MNVLNVFCWGIQQCVHQFCLHCVESVRCLFKWRFLQYCYTSGDFSIIWLMKLDSLFGFNASWGFALMLHLTCWASILWHQRMWVLDSFYSDYFCRWDCLLCLHASPLPHLVGIVTFDRQNDYQIFELYPFLLILVGVAYKLFLAEILECVSASVMLVGLLLSPSYPPQKIMLFKFAALFLSPCVPLFLLGFHGLLFFF